MAEEKSFKETLNLPKTEFPIRAGLVNREPQILEEFTSGIKYWNEKEIDPFSTLFCDIVSGI